MKVIIVLITYFLLVNLLGFYAMYNDKLVFDFDLEEYKKAKKAEDDAGAKRKEELQKIVELAKENNVCRFRAEDGTTALFAKDGSFRLYKPAERTVAV